MKRDYLFGAVPVCRARLTVSFIATLLCLTAMVSPAAELSVMADVPRPPCAEAYAGGCELSSDQLYQASLGPPDQIQMWDFRIDANGPLDGVYSGAADSTMRIESIWRKTIFDDAQPDESGTVHFHADLDQGYYRIAVASGSQGSGTPYSINANFPSEPGRQAPAATQCNGKVIRGFGNVYNTDATLRMRVGCPLAPERGLLLAEQGFEYGHMLWRSDTRQIVVATDHNNYQLSPDTYVEGELESAILAPPGLLAPIRGFGKLWRQQPGLINEIGFARGPERGFQGAIQDFENGTMIWMGADQRVIRILYPDRTWSLVWDTFVDS